MRPQLYPTASPTAPMSGAVWRARYRHAVHATGSQLHPAAQAATGRLLAREYAQSKYYAATAHAIRGTTTPAGRALSRARGDAGHWNRSARKAAARRMAEEFRTFPG